MNDKQTAKPIYAVYELKDDQIERQIGILFEWNTGEKEMRWLIPPASFEGGQILKVPLNACDEDPTQDDRVL